LDVNIPFLNHVGPQQPNVPLTVVLEGPLPDISASFLSIQLNFPALSIGAGRHSFTNRLVCHRSDTEALPHYLIPVCIFHKQYN
jgi:hypothetical protein